MAFEAADLNDDHMLSRAEYMQLRMNTVDDRLVYYYRGDTRQQAETDFARTFAEIDMDRNGWISATEFANAPAVSSRGRTTAGLGSDMGWTPEYMTVAYYLAANPVDADVVEGKKVLNLKGAEVGEIDEIIRTDQGRYYAMIDLQGTPMYRPGRMERDRAGVPLEDLLLFSGGSSVMLSTRGEEYLKEADARELEWRDYERVERLYRIGA